MKAKIILVAAGFGVSFCLGAAVKPKLKFPYAGPELNKPCGKTELEWRCATRGVRDDKPITLTTQFSMVGLSAEPRAKGLLVDAHLERRAGILLPYACRGWNAALRDAAKTAYAHALRRFGTGKELGKPMTNWNDICVRLHLDDRIAMIALEGQFDALKRGSPD